MKREVSIYFLKKPFRFSIMYKFIGLIGWKILIAILKFQAMFFNKGLIQFFLIECLKFSFHEPVHQYHANIFGEQEVSKNDDVYEKEKPSCYSNSNLVENVSTLVLFADQTLISHFNLDKRISLKSHIFNALQFPRQIVHKLISTLDFERTIFEPVLLFG